MNSSYALKIRLQVQLFNDRSQRSNVLQNHYSAVFRRRTSTLPRGTVLFWRNSKEVALCAIDCSKFDLRAKPIQLSLAKREARPGSLGSWCITHSPFLREEKGKHGVLEFFVLLISRQSSSVSGFYRLLTPFELMRYKLKVCAWLRRSEERI